MDETISFAANISSSRLDSTAASDYIASWVDYSYADLDFMSLLQSLLTLQGVLFLFDYIYRSYQTLRLVSKFWSRGVVKLPKIDTRMKKPEINQKAFIMTEWFFQLLPFFGLQILIIVLFVTAVVWIISGILIPEYNGYIAACVDHTAESTYISRNLYSFAYNYAAMDGNANIAQGLSEYDLRVSEYCTSTSALSAERYAGNLNSLYYYNYTIAVRLFF